jgi:cyclic pyranopterin phosphate synthase
MVPSWSGGVGGVNGIIPFMSDLTHVGDDGRARMVDVAGKEATERRAVARAIVLMSPETAAKLRAGDTPKGDVLGTARIAGIQAAKRTDELIPLCHGLSLSFVDVEAALAENSVTLTAEAQWRRRASRWRRSPPPRSPP